MKTKALQTLQIMLMVGGAASVIVLSLIVGVRLALHLHSMLP